MIDEQMPGDAEPALKFDARTVLISMWCHRHRFLLVLLVAMLAGILLVALPVAIVGSKFFF